MRMKQKERVDALPSGRAGGGCRESGRCSRPPGFRLVRLLPEGEGEQPPVQIAEEAREDAAVGDDGVSEFVPERPIEVAGRDA